MTEQLPLKLSSRAGVTNPANSVIYFAVSQLTEAADFFNIWILVWIICVLKLCDVFLQRISTNFQRSSNDIVIVGED